MNKSSNTKVNNTKLNNTKVNNMNATSATSATNSTTGSNSTKVSNSNNSTSSTNSTKENSVNNTKSNNIKVNNAKPAPSTGYSGSKIIGIGLIFIVLVIVLGATYWLYNYYSKKSFVTILDVDAMPDVKSATSNFDIASNLVPNSTYSNEYTISFWVNILDYNYNYGKEKVILRRGDKGSANPEILLAPKKNDLIVRIKLQATKPTNSGSTFIDIPISQNLVPNLNNYEDTLSEGQVMYDESQTKSININKITKENFNISSLPAPAIFEMKSDSDSNINKVLSMNNDLGDNKIDYPTIQYATTNSNTFDDTYFKMISGNDISGTIVSNGNDYTRGGNHSTNESFDDVADAKNAVDNFLLDIVSIMDIVAPTTLTEPEKYTIMGSVCNILVDFLSQMNSIIKENGTIFDTIIANLKTNMTKISTSTQLTNAIDKLVTDTNTLMKYNKNTFDYTTLVTTINDGPFIKKYNLQPIDANIFNITNTLIDNLIILIQQFLILVLQGSIDGNIPKGKGTSKSTSSKPQTCMSDNDYNSNSDPTVGTCVAKMIPLQKWVNIIVSVYNQVVDIYIDGLLTSSCVLKSFPDISTSDVSLTPDGGFSGSISRVKFLNNAMTVEKAKLIYNDGPIFSESLFSQIPSWVYWTLLVIIIICLAYTFLV